jgi:hypothetical protein
MRASDVIASAGTRKRLGPALGEICGWLWPKDCQTCGQALKGQPALCVDNYDAFAAASLHHPRCRPAAWNESAHMSVSQGANISWTSQAWVGFPLIRGERGMDPRPLLLVNPSLEMVFLARADDGWQPEIAQSFPAAGLQPAGSVEVDRPVHGLAASLSAGAVAVRQLVPPFEVYTSPAEAPFISQVQETGGLLFGVTHLVNPATPVSADQMDMLMLTGTVLMGWTSLRS